MASIFPKYENLEFIFNDKTIIINRHPEIGFYRAKDFKQIAPNKEPKNWKDKLKNQRLEKIKKSTGLERDDMTNRKNGLMWLNPKVVEFYAEWVDKDLIGIIKPLLESVENSVITESIEEKEEKEEKEFKDPQDDIFAYEKYKIEYSEHFIINASNIFKLGNYYNSKIYLKKSDKSFGHWKERKLSYNLINYVKEKYPNYPKIFYKTSNGKVHQIFTHPTIVIDMAKYISETYYNFIKEWLEHKEQKFEEFYKNIKVPEEVKSENPETCETSENTQEIELVKKFDEKIEDDKNVSTYYYNKKPFRMIFYKNKHWCCNKDILDIVSCARSHFNRLDNNYREEYSLLINKFKRTIMIINRDAVVDILKNMKSQKASLLYDWLVNLISSIEPTKSTIEEPEEPEEKYVNNKLKTTYFKSYKLRIILLDNVKWIIAKDVIKMLPSIAKNIISSYSGPNKIQYKIKKVGETGKSMNLINIEMLIEIETETPEKLKWKVRELISFIKYGILHQIKREDEIQLNIENRKKTLEEKEEKTSGLELIPKTDGVLNMNGFEIISRSSDGYVNATQLCKADNREFKTWMRRKNTKKYLNLLSSSVQICTDQLIKYQTGINEFRATWVHPRIAINIAQWISPEFDVAISGWIENLKKENKQLRKEKELRLIPKTDGDLDINGIQIICRSSDGYINATQMCKAGGKLFKNWKRLDYVEELISELFDEAHICTASIIKYQTGRGSKQGTWIHPDLAVPLAQWLSPKFAIKVSRWIRELALTGSVKLGQEKSSEELQELQKQLSHEKKKYLKLEKNHNSMLRRRTYKPLFQTRNCFYIVADAEYGAKDRYKIGITDDIEERLKSHRTDIPCLKIYFLVYIENMKDMEDHMLRKFDDVRIPANHEWINADLKTLKNTAYEYLSNCKSAYLIDENIHTYNKNIVN
jgi:hypothetical protein